MILLRLSLIVICWLATASHGYSNECQECSSTGTYKCGPDATCVCHIGFYGKFCEDQQQQCSDTQCHGGKCRFQYGSFECVCPEGRWGRLCERSDEEVAHLTQADHSLAPPHCEENEECEPPHLKVTCSHENLDACDEKGNVRPFKKCPYPWYCFEAFRNGKCDWECERPECLYDGYECVTKRKCNESCILPSGVCDLECSVRHQINPNLAAAPTVLQFSLTVSEKFWWDHKREIIANISEPLRTPLVYVPELNPVLERNKREKVRSRDRRRAANEQGLLNVSLKLLTWHCSNRAVCTDNGVVAGEHIAVAAAEVKADASLAVIEGIIVTPPVKKTFNATLLVCLIVIAIPILIVGYRVVTAPVWFPPPEDDEEAAVLPAQEIPLNPLNGTPTPLHEEALYLSRISLPIRQEYVNRKDEQGRTPLFWLIASEKSSQLMLEDVNELVKAGANPNISDNSGATPLSIAIRAVRPSVCDRLVQWGADPAAVTHSGASCLHLAVAQDDVHCVQWLLGFPAVRNNIDEVDESDRTPLAMAALGGKSSPQIARILIAAGADIDVQGDQTTMWRYRGRSALHWAAIGNNLDVMQVLLQHRCDVSCVDCEGCTPLHLAVQRCSEAAVRMLLEAHANTDIPNGFDAIPLTIAKEKGMLQLIDLLTSYTDVRKEELVVKKRSKKRRRVEKEMTHQETMKQKKLEAFMGQQDVASLDSQGFTNGALIHSDYCSSDTYEQSNYGSAMGALSNSDYGSSSGYTHEEQSNYNNWMGDTFEPTHDYGIADYGITNSSVITPPPSVEQHETHHGEENKPDMLATLALMCDLTY